MHLFKTITADQDRLANKLSNPGALLVYTDATDTKEDILLDAAIIYPDGTSERVPKSKLDELFGIQSENLMVMGSLNIKDLPKGYQLPVFLKEPLIRAAYDTEKADSIFQNSKKIKYMHVLIKAINKAFEDEIDIKEELSEEHNLTDFIYVLSCIVPTHYHNQLTGSKLNLLDFNHLANKLCIQYNYDLKEFLKKEEKK